MLRWTVECGSEGSEGCSSPACAETSLLLARRTSSQMPPRLSRWRLVQSLPLRDRAASDQGPGHSAVRTGSSPNARNRPTTHVPQTLLHLVRRLHASLAPTDREDGVADGAGPWRCSAGVTTASTRTWDRRTEARQTAPVLCAPAMASNHPRFRELAMTPLLPPQRPADGQQRAALRRVGDGRGPEV